MRLISQDGMIDVPYENLTISVDNDNDDGKVHILARGIVEYLSIIIAVYSNTDKALKVMAMLRSTYVNNEYYKSLCNGIVIPLPNNSDDMKEKMIATKAFRETTIFQFPKDEEVEV